jgi:hypothetical protein
MNKSVRRRKIGIEVGLATAVLLGLVVWAKSAEMAGVRAPSPTTGTLIRVPIFGGAAQFLEAQTRAKVARVRTDMRALAIACEAYYVDTNVYPAFAVGAKSVNGALGTSYPAFFLPSFRLPEALPPEVVRQTRQGQRFMTLTTPLAYLVRYPGDSFTSGSKATFVYWSVFPGQPDPSGKIVDKDSPVRGVGWIFVSPGPDGEYDLAGEWDAYNPTVALEKSRLLTGTNKKGSALTYDPTNGTMSRGDIWRVKQ